MIHWRWSMMAIDDASWLLKGSLKGSSWRPAWLVWIVIWIVQRMVSSKGSSTPNHHMDIFKSLREDDMGNVAVRQRECLGHNLREQFTDNLNGQSHLQFSRRSRRTVESTTTVEPNLFGNCSMNCSDELFYELFWWIVLWIVLMNCSDELFWWYFWVREFECSWKINQWIFL